MNRNYPFQWGYDDIGSSPNPWSEIYRGLSPASKPEVQAIINFCQQHHFYLAIDYHSYGNLILYPWCYQEAYTPDHKKFKKIAIEISSINQYRFGTLWELLYLANGNVKDWMYGQEKILALTFEVGEDFWQPDEEVINRQVQENIQANLALIKQVIRDNRSWLAKLLSKIWIF